MIHIYFFSRNDLLWPREYHYFLIIAFLLSQYLLIISACLCFLSFDHAVPFRFSLFSTKTLISFNFFRIVLYPGSFSSVIFNFSDSSHILFYISSYALVFTDSVSRGPFLPCDCRILVFWILFRFLGLLSPCRLL